MKRLYILMILVVISLIGCNSHKNRLTSANKGSASIEQSDTSSVGNEETRKDSSEVGCKTETNVEFSSEQTKFVASKKYKNWFYISIFINTCFIVIIVYLIITVYKKNNYISRLRKDIENDKWRERRENDSKKWYKKNVSIDSSMTKSETESSLNNRTEQETATEEKEKSNVIDLHLKNEYKYLMPAYQGRFTKLFDEPSGKTRFRCWQEDNVWRFEFHGDLKTAIENYNSTFDETCVVKGSYKGATQYKTEIFGTLDKDLKILTKSVIRLY